MSADDPRGGHHELCDVFQRAPDLGPSQKPCNCRRIMNAPECTGVSAVWCPIHGDCACEDRESGDLDDKDCPLHGWNSTHAETPGAGEVDRG